MSRSNFLPGNSNQTTQAIIGDIVHVYAKNKANVHFLQRFKRKIPIEWIFHAYSNDEHAGCFDRKCILSQNYAKYLCVYESAYICYETPKRGIFKNLVEKFTPWLTWACENFIEKRLVGNHLLQLRYYVMISFEWQHICSVAFLTFEFKHWPI